MSDLLLGNYQLRLVEICLEKDIVNGLRGTSFDELTQCIFITNSLRGLVLVFNREGGYLYKFGIHTGIFKLSSPWYVFVYKNTVYVSDYSTCLVSIYTLEGYHITSFGGKGTVRGKFQCVNGILVDPSSETLYLCDSENSRIQKYSDEGIITTFGEEFVRNPYSIKKSLETIFVGTQNWIHTFSLNDIHLSRIDLEHTENLSRYYFNIGDNQDIIISHSNSDCIYVLNSDGKLLGTFKRRSKKQHLSSLMFNLRAQVIVVCPLEEN